MSWRVTFVGALAILAMSTRLARADDGAGGCVARSLDHAWWTGPMLANSASTLPRGHALVEPYLFDATAHASFDERGIAHRAPQSNGFGSLTYVVYGLTDRLGVALIPTAGYNTVSGGPSSSGIGLGDTSLLAQYRLTQFRPCRSVPTMSVAIEETFPSGQYDELTRPTDGLGGGAYTTTLAFYAQTYFWLPNGRIVRLRLNASEALSRPVTLDGSSVYETTAGFEGQAAPGRTALVDVSWEYSATQRWVLALDTTFRHAGRTRVAGATATGAGSPASVVFQTEASDVFALAPAIEYSWSARVGVLLGVRLVPAGRNAAASVTPAVAVNIVR